MAEGDHSVGLGLWMPPPSSAGVRKGFESDVGDRKGRCASRLIDTSPAGPLLMPSCCSSCSMRSSRPRTKLSEIRQRRRLRDDNTLTPPDTMPSDDPPRGNCMRIVRPRSCYTVEAIDHISSSVRGNASKTPLPAPGLEGRVALF